MVERMRVKQFFARLLCPSCNQSMEIKVAKEKDSKKCRNCNHTIEFFWRGHMEVHGEDKGKLCYTCEKNEPMEGSTECRECKIASKKSLLEVHEQNTENLKEKIKELEAKK